MQRRLIMLALAATAALGACTRDNARPADSALSTDLSLAAQQRGYTPLDSLSAAERANALTTPAPAPVGTAPRASGTSSRTASSGTRTTRRSSSGTTRSSGGTVATSSAPTSHEVVVKHNQRDAAIGAAAGAVIGATTSRNKVKGGIIGAAVGGILGGVIGNNVDKTKKTVP